MKYRVHIQKTDEGYSVSVPGLPGCWSQGESEEEALRNIREAIADYVAVVESMTPEAETRTVDVA